MKKNRNASWEIYDLGTNKDERNNVAAQHPKLIICFEGILKKEYNLRISSNGNLLVRSSATQ
ncbi:MAG: hypothetical protein ABIU55_00560 [Ferruginibacter sp.]